MLTQSRLKELLSYDESTGIFTWRKPSNRGVKSGNVAGTISRGYRRITIDKAQYFAHRLAWLYVYGKWPDHFIDHLNGVRDDNRISNLRDIEKYINQQNTRKAFGDNSSHTLGVSKHYGKFQARIVVNYKTIWLGTFDDPESAGAAYIEAKRKLHEGCTI